MAVVWDLGIVVYCAAMGFAAAGAVSSLYQWLTSERVDFALAQTSLPRMAVSILVNMFAGPFIVVSKVVSGLRAHEIRAPMALAGVIVAGMWSVVAGIFYVSLLISA